MRHARRNGRCLQLTHSIATNHRNPLPLNKKVKPDTPFGYISLTTKSHMRVYYILCIFLSIYFADVLRISPKCLALAYAGTYLVLNIVRDGRDIIRYLLFCLLPIRYGKIVSPYRLQQKTANI